MPAYIDLQGGRQRNLPDRKVKDAGRQIHKVIKQKGMEKDMKKAVRNLIAAAVMAATVAVTALTAFAGSAYVQNDMNFRSSASMTGKIIGGVPAGAKVEVIGSQNGWDLVVYNGVTGYIHGGNTGSSYTPPVEASPMVRVETSNQTQSVNNNTAAAAGTLRVRNLQSGYLAVRNAPAYEFENEIGRLYNGMAVQITGGYSGNGYVWVYSPDLGISGWVTQSFIG